MWLDRDTGLGLGLGLALGVGSGPNGKTYYFSTTGSDANDGLTPATPKQTIAAANALTLNTGDTVAFKGGDTFSTTTTLVPQAGATYTSYGAGRAKISVTSDIAAIQWYHLNAVTVSNLNVESTVTSTSSGISAYAYLSSFSDVTITNCTATNFKYGMFVGGEGGFNITNVTVSGCTAYNNRDSGIFIYGANTTRDNVRNVLISDCTSYTNDKNGIVVNGTSGFTVTRCTAYGNGVNGESIGIFTYNSKNGVIRYCESYNNVSTGNDGGGYDGEDFDNVVFEYCYSHGNQGAGFLIYNYAGANPVTNGTIRYCVSINDGTNTTNYTGIWVNVGTGINVYNNTVYNSLAGGACMKLASAAAGFVANNLFVASGTAAPFTGTAGASMTVDTNVWYGGTGTSAGTGKITTDPKLVSPGSAPTIGIWNPSSLSGYQIQSGSPALDTGANLASLYGITMPSADFYGNTIGALPTNLGAYDGAGVSAAASFFLLEDGSSKLLLENGTDRLILEA